MPDHVHWWLLPSPTSGTVVGRCRYCGAEREFVAHWDSVASWKWPDKRTEQEAEDYRAWLREELERAK